MNLRWLFLDYVDSTLPLDRAARRAVRSRALHLARHPELTRRFQAKNQHIRRRKNMLNLVYALIPAACQSAAMIIFFTGNFGAGMTWLMVPLLILTQVILTWVTMSLIGRFVWRPYVLLALREHGYEFCLNCEYWLRDLPEGVTHCPECGAERIPLHEIPGGAKGTA